MRLSAPQKSMGHCQSTSRVTPTPRARELLAQGLITSVPFLLKGGSLGLSTRRLETATLRGLLQITGLRSSEV